jgi:hypothetical protein
MNHREGLVGVHVLASQVVSGCRKRGRCCNISQGMEGGESLAPQPLVLVSLATDTPEGSTKLGALGHSLLMEGQAEPALC